MPSSRVVEICINLSKILRGYQEILFFLLCLYIIGFMQEIISYGPSFVCMVDQLAEGTV